MTYLIGYLLLLAFLLLANHGGHRKAHQPANVRRCGIPTCGRKLLAGQFSLCPQCVAELLERSRRAS